MEIASLQHLIIKQNGQDKVEQLNLYGQELNSIDELIDLIKDQLHYKRTPKSKIYSQQGIELQGDDVIYLRDGETLYYDYKGKEFDPCQIIDQYEKEQELGEGGFGKVYRGRNKESNQLVAIKYIDLTEYLKSANKIEDIYKESKILQMLNHKSIIKLISAFVLKNDLILVMEYADGGELLDYVEEKGGLDELEARSIIKQVIMAMDDCHQKGVIHRDLKLENVLFESKARTKIKVVDFGISGMCKGNMAEKNDAGTLRYMPPEVLLDNYSNANPAMDIWAIGIMLYCMVYDKFPFNGPDSQTIKDKIIYEHFKVPKDVAVTEEFLDFVKSCLQKDPQERIDLYSIKTHKWILLCDSAIQLKIELAQQVIKREQKKAEDEKIKLQFNQFTISNLDEEEKNEVNIQQYLRKDIDHSIGGSPNRKRASNEDRRKSALNLINPKITNQKSKNKRQSILDPIGMGGINNQNFQSKYLKLEMIQEYDEAYSRKKHNKNSKSINKFGQDTRDSWLTKQ